MGIATWHHAARWGFKFHRVGVRRDTGTGKHAAVALHGGLRGCQRSGCAGGPSFPGPGPERPGGAGDSEVRMPVALAPQKSSRTAEWPSGTLLSAVALLWDRGVSRLRSLGSSGFSVLKVNRRCWGRSNVPDPPPGWLDHHSSSSVGGSRLELHTERYGPLNEPSVDVSTRLSR
jgi:hypothetical protein